MEFTLTSYAITPEDAAYFRLEDYAQHTLQYQEEHDKEEKPKNHAVLQDGHTIDELFVDDHGDDTR